jgi:hypothetical protein
MSRLRKYLDTDWFIILYIVSMFIGNAFVFSLFPALNNLPMWLLYITLLLCGSVICIIGLILILFIDTKLEERRARRNEYKRK